MRRLRWVVWATLCLAFVISILHRTALAVVAADLMADFGIGATAFGGLVSVYFYVYTVMQIPSGVLADYLGPRRTATAGLLVAAAASFLMAAATGIALAYVGRFLIALGVSVLFIAVVKVQATWFQSREFGLITGLTVLMAFVGSSLTTVPLASLAGGLGWRGALHVIGLVTLALGIAAWWLVRDRPADAGLPQPELQAAPAPPGGIWASVRLVLHTRATWPIFLTFFCFYGTYITFLGMWSIPYLTQTFGLSRSAAAGYVLLANLGCIAGGPLVGVVSDRILRRRRLPYAVGIVLHLAAWVPLLLPVAPARLLPYLGPLLFLQGLTWTVFLLSWALAKEVNHPGLAGIATGTVNAAGFFCAALLQPLLGLILDAMWDGTLQAGLPVYPAAAYRTVVAITMGLSLVGLLGLAWTPETRCRSIHGDGSPAGEVAAETTGAAS